MYSVWSRFKSVNELVKIMSMFEPVKQVQVSVRHSCRLSK
jgi:hypothetical protein